MQKLQYESSWDKTLSNKDRKIIEEIFLETSLPKQSRFQFTSLWQAMNHKGELLVTVLVHNFSHQVCSFINKNLRYIEKNEIIAEHTFTLPSLTVQPETSMPWTFIFPIESLMSHGSLENGHLEYLND
ncbi:SLAP domain-containing protein [Peribacillus huizhouensis]|uniref:SLAP domain-containing protein n=1 Tax=Peribacillus huizhouensis TaxID=1501239 RepID=A0ABR6CUZ0_9BACI|nr:SLAP domain-containing protein [Peribacillus huizhouensis]MBA9028425.1 SLAP domain-containing protein [Peribacillus huizhouensis]